MVFGIMIRFDDDYFHRRLGIQTMGSPVKLVALALTLAISIPARVQGESLPPAELDSLEYFEGNWSCRQPADNNDPSGAFNWNVELGLNDFWYLGGIEQINPPKDKPSIKSREFLGYDVVANKLTRSVVLGDGSSYNMTASDWENNQLVWTGSLIRKGELSPLRQIMAQDSPDKFTTTYLVLGDSDNWIPIVDETCDRTKS